MTEQEFKERMKKADDIIMAETGLMHDDFVDCAWWDYMEANGGEFSRNNLFEFMGQYDELFRQMVGV